MRATRQTMKLAASVAATCLLTACAEPARVGAMIAPVSTASLVPASSPLANAVKIGDVTGGGATSPLWESNVSADDFRAALTESLRLQAALAPGAAKYTLDASLQSLDRPLAGFDMTVTASVHYTLRTEPARTAAWDQLVTTPYTAKLGDALVGSDRLRLAEEGAIRENISTAIGAMVHALTPAAP